MRRLSAVLPLVLVLGACTVGPSYHRPEIKSPDQYYGQPGPPSAPSFADLAWWDVFQDPTLRSLIEESLRNGQDLKLATARVEEARARYGIAGAARFPQIGYSGEVARERLSEFELGAPASGQSFTAFTANVNLSWEIDLWGRVRRLTEQAKAQYLSTEEARRAVILGLVAEVASAYFDLRQLDEDLEIAQRNTVTFEDTFNLFKRQLEGGVASALETSDAEAAWAKEAAQIPLIESQIVAKENQLNLLLGRTPGPIPRGAVLPEQPLRPEVPPGIPSTLLERRPDLLQGEDALIAANANIGVARAAFFPAISLTGMFGGLSPDFKDLLNKGQTWTVGAGLTGPIFQGGAIRSQYKVAQAQFEEAKAQYLKAVLNAFGEVSTSLVGLDKLGAAEKQRVRAVNAYQEAVRLARLRYESGLSAYFEVIDAMQNLLGSENDLAQVQHDRLIAMVNLYKALGGGWQLPQEKVEPGAPPPPATP
jgi:multidrug efflux system outer membrane protein